MALQVRLDPRALQRHIGQQPATPYVLSVSGAGAAPVDLTGTIPGTIATGFPQAPADGDEIDVLVDATNGVCWRFRYLAARAGSNPWVFVGGSPLSASVTAAETTTSATFADLATVGPSIIVPRTGLYVISMYARMQNSIATNGSQLTPTSPTLAAVVGNALRADSATAAAGYRIGASTLPLGLTAGEALKLQYEVFGGAGTSTFSDRRISILPTSVT